jgi:hypothetical protein
MLCGLEFECDVLFEVEDGRTIHGEVAAVSRMPLVVLFGVLFGEDHADESDDCVVVVEDADNVEPPFDLLRNLLTARCAVFNDH